MGLDVYLYRCADRAAEKKLEEKYEKLSNKIWKTLPEKATKAEQKEVGDKCEKLALEIGLDKYGSSKKSECISLTSKIHPEHSLYKVGYFRSSYNEGGVNHILRQYGLPDLNDLFNPTGEYEFMPDWEDAKAKTLDVIKKLRALNAGELSNVSMMCISHNPFVDKKELPASEAAAMNIMREELKGYANKKNTKDSEFFKQYANRYGDFAIGEPYEVIGLIPGIDGLGSGPCVYVAYRTKESRLAWYIEALEIVVETCDYVLSHKSKDEFYLHWSG